MNQRWINAGHYIPQLAIEILQGNQNKDSLRVNLEGLLIGNPYFRQFDDIYFFEVLYTRYIISEETFQGYKAFVSLFLVIFNQDFGITNISLVWEQDKRFNGLLKYLPESLSRNGHIQI